MISKTLGNITVVPHYSSVFRILENKDVTPMLLAMITESSLPLNALEVDFAVDSTGFATSRFARWLDFKYGVVQEEHDWLKCHLICGVKTGIVTAVAVSDKYVHDTNLLPALVKSTAQNFNISEVSADKGYLSRDNANAIVEVGGTPYLAIKSNSTSEGTGAWMDMYYFFMSRRDEFLEHYHKRSNVEATFSAIKRKFGDNLRSRSGTAMINETLCKILCHNLVVLNKAMYVLGLEPEFYQQEAA